MKSKYSILLLLALTASCFNTVIHDPADHASKAQAIIIEAISLEDNIDDITIRKLYISKFKEANKYAEGISKGELNVLYDTWGDYFRDHFYEAIRLTLEAEKDESFNSIDISAQATYHLNIYGEWWNEHRVDIDELLRKE